MNNYFNDESYPYEYEMNYDGYTEDIPYPTEEEMEMLAKEFGDIPDITNDDMPF